MATSLEAAQKNYQNAVKQGQGDAADAYWQQILKLQTQTNPNDPWQSTNPNAPNYLTPLPTIQNTTTAPTGVSTDYLQQQVTNPSFPAGGQQVYTPQEEKPGETLPTGTGDIPSPPSFTPQQIQAAGLTPEQITALGIDPATMTAAQGTAQQGIVTPESTVRGQMELLMDDVDQGNAPWADAAIRKANAAMQARGLGQSSMAGAAIAQSIIESALPIAQLDAATYGTINLTNLRNRQEAMLTNTAAENAARQLNTQNINDVNKFMSSLKNDILKFNVDQKNAMDKFNVEQDTSVKQFFVQMQDAAEKFNAQNAMLIATSNAEWRRSINTANTAGINATNMVNTQNLFNISQQSLANLWQRSRDVFNWANMTAENEKDRAFQIAQYTTQHADYMSDLSKAERNDLASSIGNLMWNVFSDNFFDNEA